MNIPRQHQRFNHTQTKSRFFTFLLALLLTVTAASFTNPVSAATYKDVPSTYWGYNAINRVTDLGFMSGDLSGNFSPNATLDKFETIKILAKMAGYKYTGATTAEQTYYNNCYTKHSGYINLFVKKFSLWNATTDKEVAFLLEKGVLKNEDLNQFVVIVNNRETLRMLSREEACVFFVRLMNATSKVSNTTANPFRDDASISATAKPYVYYLRSLGVVSGDANNNFAPKSAVTKAAMASMINTVWTLMSSSPAATPTTPTATAQPTATPAPTATSANTTTISGKIGKLYYDFRALQVSSSDANNNKIYPAAANVTITINGAAKTFADLREGMNFSAVVVNGDMISITATSNGTITPVTPTPTTKPTATPTTKPTATPTPTPATAAKNRKFSGELVAKTAGTTAAALPVLTIQEKSGQLNEILVPSNASIKRNNTATPWGNLRIGDTVEVSTEYDKLLTLTATGKLSAVDGFVREIRITATNAELTISDTGNSTKTTVYPVATNLVNPYNFRIGAKLRLQLDSKEVISYSVLQDTGALGTTGVITRLTPVLIEIRDTATNTKREYTIDSKTVVRDANTDKVVNMTTLDLNSLVTVATDPTATTRAKTIYVLAY